MNRNYAYFLLFVIIAAILVGVYYRAEFEVKDFWVLGIAVSAVIYSAFQSLEMSRSNAIAQTALEQAEAAQRRQTITDAVLEAAPIIRDGMESARIQDFGENYATLIRNQPRLSVLLPRDLVEHYQNAVTITIGLQQLAIVQSNVTANSPQRLQSAAEERDRLNKRLKLLRDELDESVRAFFHPENEPNN